MAKGGRESTKHGRCVAHEYPWGTGQAQSSNLVSPALPPSAYQSTTLRVAIEARQGACRTIKNLHDLFEACEKADAQGTNSEAVKGKAAPLLH